MNKTQHPKKPVFACTLSHDEAELVDHWMLRKFGPSMDRAKLMRYALQNLSRIPLVDTRPRKPARKNVLGSEAQRFIQLNHSRMDFDFLEEHFDLDSNQLAIAARGPID